MKAKAAFYLLILCRQLLSLERYSRKIGVEIKVHCRTEGVLQYTVKKIRKIYKELAAKIKMWVRRGSWGAARLIQ